MGFKYKLRGQELTGFGANILETILKNREIEDIGAFLNVNESSIENEMLYDYIHEASIKIIEHIDKESNIVILVDADCDGFTSGAFMHQYVERLAKHRNKNINITYVMHGAKAHGLTNEIMKKLEDMKCDLLLIPDAGTNDIKQCKILKGKGIDIVVADHHNSEEGCGINPYAIIVNNQLSQRITNKAMTGVGVVYKVCKHIDKQLNINFVDDYLDLVTIGTIADSADLRNLESRYFVLQGIDKISKQRNMNKMITELIKAKSYDMKNKVNIIGMAFYVSPMINSVIRCGTADEQEIVFRAFLNIEERCIDTIRGRGEVEMSLQEYAVRLCGKCKRKQKKLTDEGIVKAKEQIEKFGLHKNGILVVNATGLVEKNFGGLVANKLKDIYQKPCLMLLKHSDGFSGSARGYDKKDIKNFQRWCLDTGLFEFASGHNNAFGTKVKDEKINDLFALIGKMEVPEELIYDVDMIFNEKTINKAIIESVAKYGYIWGNSVDEPTFAVENIIINKSDINLMGANKNTIKFKYGDIVFMLFNSSEDKYNEMIQNDAIKLTAIGRFSVNEYMGNVTPQIMIENMMHEPSQSVFRF